MQSPDVQTTATSRVYSEVQRHPYEALKIEDYDMRRPPILKYNFSLLLSQEISKLEGACIRISQLEKI